ncbi:MAG: GGDEF domain-containing protein [Acidobacteriaceae bacterium]|nr:GGDEF domain-containing protein [Acidobacteriaceae bacterium]
MHLTILLLLRGHFVLFSFIVGLAPLLAAACILWRTQQIERWHRSAWYWITVGLVLWSTAQMNELHVTQLANNTTPTFADYLFFLVAIPLLLGASSTPATRNIPSVRVLNALQSVLATGLIYVRIFRMPVNASTGGVSALYDIEFLVLFLTVSLRYLSATVPEDKRTLSALWLYFALYMPAEATVDYVSRLYHLQVGTPLDLVFTLPFLFLGWRALKMPTDEVDNATDKAAPRWRLFLQSLCPMLFTCGVFALGVSVASQHLAIASIVMLLTMVLQGLHSGVIQTRFVLDRERLQRQEQQLLDANARLEELSLVDHLTGISNRRHLAQVLEREWERAARHNEWISILMIDVDYFKGVNDKHGHAYGDECLRALAQLLTQINRDMDFSSRYGGEEFLVMLPSTNATGASTVAERLHSALRECNLINEASPLQRLTVSIGIATTKVHRGMSSAPFLETADAALYEAKQAGRNQTRVAREMVGVQGFSDRAASR